MLRGSVAILAGAGRVNSVGAATARLLAKEGCNLLINTLKNREQAKKVADECRALGAETEIFIGDVTKASTCSEISEFVQSKWKRADILVNCVGATKSASYEKLEQLTEKDFAALFATNATAPFLMAQAFQSQLRAAHGVIINVSSAAGITGKGSSIAYAAAKGAENTLTLALSQALSPEIRVNAVCPSFIDSSWWDETVKKDEGRYQNLIKSMQESNLLKRVLTPADVAFTILHLIKSPVITGELIRLDAGAHVGKANKRDDEDIVKVKNN